MLLYDGVLFSGGVTIPTIKTELVVDVSYAKYISQKVVLYKTDVLLTHSALIPSNTLINPNTCGKGLFIITIRLRGEVT